MSDTATDFDADALRSYLSSVLETTVTDTEVVSDGLNLVVAISTADADRYVLRRPNKLRESGLFVDLRTEYATLKRLRDTDVPVPEPVRFCDDESVPGGPFCLTTALDGEPFPRGEDLPRRYRDPDARRRIAQQSVDTLARIHSLPTEPFEDVLERRPPRDQLDAATDRLDEAARVTGQEFPTLRAVGDWLAEHVPPSPTTSLTHGDFRTGNLLFTGTDDGRPDLTGVLDWETAALGDPLAELGYFLLDWRGADDPRPAPDAFADLEARYPDHDGMTWVRRMHEHGLSPFAADAGSLGRRELVARYEGATGARFEHERFYVANATFGLATVWADLDRNRVATGAAPEREPLIEYLALVAERITNGASPL
ncbi:phosphotransferase family protein [Halobium salinum]|uniref:Phosphotransferase family protein n=1 Tax=Halobium salinum TaxID=1364940 RepID=A0ABD5PCQ8_9EURY|nr:phosphotransferase family protein [Halobium salinum]